MSKSKRVLLGIITIWPISYFLLFIGQFVYLFISIEDRKGKGFPIPFEVLLSFHLFTMFSIIGLIAFYIVFLFKTERVPKDKKTLWAIAIFLGHTISMPIFWYHYFWKSFKATSS